MNVLPIEKQKSVIACICEGMGINATCRITGASKNTVLKLLASIGEACISYHDENVRNLKTQRVECDEVWSFCYAKEKNVAKAKAAPTGAGDVWTWTALDADSKLMISYLVGGRDVEYATEFMMDLKDRLTTTVQLTTDGHKAYLKAVEKAFDWQVDYAQLVKMYGNAPEHGNGRYSPAQCTGAKKIKISGMPDVDKVSTSYVERSNLTMRMHNRRFTRLTNGFSKKIENHLHAIALFVMHYNFCKVHKTLRVSPAMEAGVSDRLWDIEDLIKLIPAPVAKKRGEYKKRQIT